MKTGVALNRKALTHTPVNQTRAFWHDLRVTSISRDKGAQNTHHVFIDVIVDGETGGKPWACGFEFQHANRESLYCRPVRLNGGEERMPVPPEANGAAVALLPPMSGLSSDEPELQPGRVSALIGEGQTAQVLRNLCFRVAETNAENWATITGEMRHVFGIELLKPERDLARGSIELSYIDRGVEFDLSSAGRGIQQTLLLLVHIYANPGAALLLDEPDAHLEILRQRQIYTLLSETARRTGSQVIPASHFEVLLNEAADKDVVVAFVGKPHRIDDRGSQVLKALREIGFEQYTSRTEGIRTLFGRFDRSRHFEGLRAATGSSGAASSRFSIRPLRREQTTTSYASFLWTQGSQAGFARIRHFRSTRTRSSAEFRLTEFRLATSRD